MPSMTGSSASLGYMLLLPPTLHTPVAAPCCTPCRAPSEAIQPILQIFLLAAAAAGGIGSGCAAGRAGTGSCSSGPAYCTSAWCLHKEQCVGAQRIKTCQSCLTVLAQTEQHKTACDCITNKGCPHRLGVCAALMQHQRRTWLQDTQGLLRSVDVWSAVLLPSRPCRSA
jgi:hypothetical protein